MDKSIVILFSFHNHPGIVTAIKETANHGFRLFENMFAESIISIDTISRSKFDRYRYCSCYYAKLEIENRKIAINAQTLTSRLYLTVIVPFRNRTAAVEDKRLVRTTVSPHSTFTGPVGVHVR